MDPIVVPVTPSGAPAVPGAPVVVNLFGLPVAARGSSARQPEPAPAPVKRPRGRPRKHPR